MSDNKKPEFQDFWDAVIAENPKMDVVQQKELASERYLKAKAEWEEANKAAKQKKAEEKSGEKVITLSEKELKDYVAKIIKDLNVSEKKPTKQSDDIEMMDEPVLFYTYDFSHTNMADRRNGKTITPREPIRFEHSYRYNIAGTSQSSAKMVNLCIAKVYAKDLVEYLRNHSRFGIQIFEDIKNVNAEDSYRAHVMVEVNNYVSKLGTHALIEKAKLTPGVTMDQDVDKVRHRLIQALADQEIANRKNLGKIRAKGMAEEYKTIKTAV